MAKNRFSALALALALAPATGFAQEAIVAPTTPTAPTLGGSDTVTLELSETASASTYREFVDRLTNFKNEVVYTKVKELFEKGIVKTEALDFDSRAYFCAKSYAVKMFESRGFTVDFNGVDLWGLTVSNLQAKLFNASGYGTQKEVVFLAVSEQNGFKWVKPSSTTTAYYTEYDSIPSGYVLSGKGTTTVKGYLWYCPSLDLYASTVKNVAPEVFGGAKCAYHVEDVEAREYTKTNYSAIYSLSGTTAPKKGYTLKGASPVAVTLRLHIQADNLNFASPTTLRGASEYSYLGSNAYPRAFMGSNDLSAWWIDDNNKTAKEGSQWGVSQLTKKNGANFASKFIGSTYKLFTCADEKALDQLGQVWISDAPIVTTYFSDNVPTFEDTNVELDPIKLNINYWSSNPIDGYNSIINWYLDKVDYNTRLWDITYTKTTSLLYGTFIGGEGLLGVTKELPYNEANREAYSRLEALAEMQRALFRELYFSEDIVMRNGFEHYKQLYYNNLISAGLHYDEEVSSH